MVITVNLEWCVPFTVDVETEEDVAAVVAHINRENLNVKVQNDLMKAVAKALYDEQWWPGEAVIRVRGSKTVDEIRE